jgi:hypothetical protein
MKTTLLISLLCIASIGSYAQDNSTQVNTDKPAVCKKYAEMPKGAVLVWPKSAYVPVGDPSCPPCYEYTSKHGLTVMECPGLWFLPDNATTAQANTDLDVQSVKAYTGNYQKVCRRDPDMPKNAVPAWPSGPYVSLQGNPECAPCYEYTSKHGIRVMECPFLYFPPETGK